MGVIATAGGASSLDDALGSSGGCGIASTSLVSVEEAVDASGLMVSSKAPIVGTCALDFFDGTASASVEGNGRLIGLTPCGYEHTYLLIVWFRTVSAHVPSHAVSPVEGMIASANPTFGAF